VRVAAAAGELRVEDTGPGLRPDELSRAFERFYLYERYGKERPVGTGLGLAIVKQLVEGMGGSVAVESDPGRLTRFTVLLPAGSRVLRAPYPSGTEA
jgi:signal transduction histidine kinase